MYKTFSSHIKIASIIGLCVFSASQNLFAAELSYKIVPNDTVGDNVTEIEVRIDPQTKNVNVVEGAITFGGSVVDSLSVEVNKDGSVFTIWPTEPLYNKDEKTIQFVGGTPDGLTKEGLLFRVRLFSTKLGKLDISWSGVKTFLNDGKGTEESTAVKSISINLEAKNTNRVVEEKRVESFFSGFNFANSVTIIVLIIILLTAFFYGYKKNIKN